MDWLVLILSLILFLFSVRVGFLFFRHRTKYNLVLFILVLIFFIITLFDLLYPGKFIFVLAAATHVFSDNPTFIKTVQTTFLVVFLVLLLVFLFYPDVKYFLLNPNSITNLKTRENIYRLLEKLFPKNTDVLCKYAYFLLSRKQELDMASSYIRKAMDINPTDSSVLGTYALILMNQQDFDEAEKYFRQANEKPPYDIGNLVNYASFLGNIRKDYGKADEYYQRAIKLAPRSSRLLAEYASFLTYKEEMEGKQE